MMKSQRFAQYAWGVIVMNLVVILWGAFVRATGSGAGCGAHWPLCNGDVIPQAPAVETLIEFIHRLTSGVALLAVVGLCIWAFRAYPRGHAVRRGAAFSLAFMLVEALIGAGLVLFELVAHNESVARIFVICAHLVTTFLLLGSLSLTAWWASGFPIPRLNGQGPLVWAILLGLVVTICIGLTGAVIALGDTLLIAYIKEGGEGAELSPLVATLKELRIVHPMVAVLSSVFLGVLGWQTSYRRPNASAKPLAWGLTLLLIVQLLAGLLNVYLKVPIAMQLIHLLLADLIWITIVLVSASALSERETADQPQTTAASIRATTH
jgi:heme A synthase